MVDGNFYHLLTIENIPEMSRTRAPLAEEAARLSPSPPGALVSRIGPRGAGGGAAQWLNVYEDCARLSAPAPPPPPPRPWAAVMDATPPTS